MTPNDVDLVQSSFAKIAPVDDETGVRFYGRLFEIAPDLRALFGGDMEEQGRMFMAMLTVTVNGLAGLDALEPTLRELAIRHVGYGVEPKDYAAVGAALMWILDESLGGDFTPEVRDAWLAAYDALSGVMIKATVKPRSPE